MPDSARKMRPSVARSYIIATIRTGMSSFAREAMIAPVSATPNCADFEATRFTVSPEPKPREMVTSRPASL